MKHLYKHCRSSCQFNAVIPILLFLLLVPQPLTAGGKFFDKVYYAICGNRNAHGSDPKVGPCRKTHAEAQKDVEKHKADWKAASSWSKHDTTVYTTSICP